MKTKEMPVKKTLRRKFNLTMGKLRPKWMRRKHKKDPLTFRAQRAKKKRREQNKRAKASRKKNRSK